MTRRGALLLAAITVVGAAVRFWGIGFGLPHTYARPDEDAIVTIATRIYRDGPNPHFFVYPTLAFWAIVAHDVDRTRWTNVLGAGALCGLAGSTKYNAVLVVLPLFVRILQQSRSEAHRARWASALCLLACCGIAAGFLAGTPFSLIDSRLFLSELRGVQVHFLGGHGADLGHGWTYHLTGSLRYGVGAPMLAAALLGGVWLAWARPATALVVLSFPVAYYVVIGAGRTVFIRYVDPILPFACLLAGITVA